MNFYDLKVKNKSGTYVSNNRFKDKVVLVVNTASKCSYAPQLEDLEKLYKKYDEDKFAILAVPSNQFKQEVGSASEAASYCKKNYGVTFQFMGLADVNGANEAELFTFLKSQKRSTFGFKKIRWNFTKFLVDQDGKVIKRYTSSKSPLKIRDDINKLLGGK